MATIQTPGGYEYEEPNLDQPDINIALSYASAYDIILDAIQNDASIEPITPPTFPYLAQSILDLLVDAMESNAVETDFDETV